MSLANLEIVSIEEVTGKMRAAMSHIDSYLKASELVSREELGRLRDGLDK